jgi:hypothetical protein
VAKLCNELTLTGIESDVFTGQVLAVAPHEADHAVLGRRIYGFNFLLALNRRNSQYGNLRKLGTV